MNQIKKILKASDVKVSDFVLKKVLKKMIKRKVLTHKNTTKARYAATGKFLSGPSVMKRKRATAKSKKQDREFRNKLRKLARKQNRGGRTFAEVIYDYVYVQRKSDKSEKAKKTRFSQIRAYLKRNNMAISRFILHKVLERLRAKKVLRLSKHRHVLTSKRMVVKN